MQPRNIQRQAEGNALNATERQLRAKLGIPKGKSNMQSTRSLRFIFPRSDPDRVTAAMRIKTE